jgi:hypothetical protein
MSSVLKKHNRQGAMHAVMMRCLLQKMMPLVQAGWLSGKDSESFRLQVGKG